MYTLKVSFYNLYLSGDMRTLKLIARNGTHTIMLRQGRLVLDDVVFEFISGNFKMVHPKRREIRRDEAIKMLHIQIQNVGRS